MIDILFMLEYCFDDLEWKLLTCWSILAKTYIISLEKCMFIIDVLLYVDFQKKIQIHAAFQVLYWQYCIQPREILIFSITNPPPPWIYSTVNSFYVDFQKKLKIHAALQVLLQIVSSRVNFYFFF